MQSFFMGIISGLLSFFSSRQSSSTAFYPNDHKLSGQERKEFSNKFLKQQGVPTPGHLPLVEDHTEATFRNEKEVAAKSGSSVRAYNAEHLAYLKNYVGAKLREAVSGGKYSLAWKLPDFIKVAKNRERILKAILRLESK